MIDKIIEMLLKEKYSDEELIKKIEIEISNQIKDIKSFGYNDWNLIDAKIGELGSAIRKEYFKDGFNSAIKIINEIKNI